MERAFHGSNSDRSSVGYLGPAGTFTEEALLSQRDLSEMSIVAMTSITEVIEAASSGDIDYGFVPIENSIEGTVLATLDSLLFDADLLIQREVSLEVHQNLLAVSGTDISEIREVYSYPVATAQVRYFLRNNLPQAEIKASTSTAEAAKFVAASKDRTKAAIAPMAAAKEYGLEAIRSSIEDHPGNETRFLLLHRRHIPKPTGNDKTTVVCFQVTDRPGSLLSILAQFSARGINLTKLDSRPTRRQLGEYCFIIDLEGHIADSLVADCLRELRTTLPELKFLGSYPSSRSPKVDESNNSPQRGAQDWIDELRGRI